MTEPLVSVKMITYNHAPYIAKAIEGVLNQKTNFPFELVIGEDCSTDGTREIVFKYKKIYPEVIRVVTSDKNVGIKKNSVRTTAELKGKYIAWCEGDDYWHNDEKLQTQLDYLENHPECGGVHSNFDIYLAKSGKVIKDYVEYRKFCVPKRMNIYDILTDCGIGFWIRTCTAMVRKNLHKKITEADDYLYKSGHFLMGDIQLWAELSLISDIVYIPKSLSTYRILEESASHSNDQIKKNIFNKSSAELKLYLCDKHKLDKKIRELIELKIYTISLRLAFLQRNADMALEIRKKKAKFTLDDWLKFYGARNSICYYALLSVASFRKFIKGRPPVG